jgi:hypothetical protein
MGTHLRFTPVLALLGALALGAAPAARAQDTSSVRADTSGVQGYGADTAAADTFQAAQPTGRADSGAAGYTGPPTDTALKAKPGVQTGPAAQDTGKAGQTGAARTSADTVVCKDGSNSPRSGNDVCLKHGGIDWTATEAALKARGETVPRMGDSASADTALKAKPGVQTGPTDTSAAGRADTSSTSQ